jgi:hypothetical protein
MYSSLLSAWDLHLTQSSSPACHLLLTESGGAHYHYHYCYLQKVLFGSSPGILPMQELQESFGEE